jgi:glycosyltransferase involved in cell wall biosynthesis
MPADLVCFTHLRWDDVTQRPHHLAAQASRSRRVYVVEEPQVGGVVPVLRTRTVDGVVVATPVIPDSTRGGDRLGLAAQLVERLAARRGIVAPWLWFWTPQLLPLSARVDAGAIVYDCMDELGSFRNPPAELVERERQLFAVADIVFTGGQALYEAKRGRHPRVHPFPSSVDVDHFRAARRPLRRDPADQAPIPHPRLGWFGVIDERFDGRLVQAVADARPDWHLVLLGPVAKVGEAELPRARNIHYLGPKPYAALPDYLGGWDVALMPFARNAATACISPTKTPEYLAGGRPVVATSIRDVVEPYGREGLVRIADDPGAFVAAVEAALRDDTRDLARRGDRFLAGRSWSATWAGMERLVEDVLAARTPVAPLTASRGRETRRRSLDAEAVAAPRLAAP